jgi:hypothetical protein
MKDYEAMQEIHSRICAQIRVHEEAITYHRDKVEELMKINIEDEFYIGNEEFPDYPGNEGMKDCYEIDKELEIWNKFKEIEEMWKLRESLDNNPKLTKEDKT